MGFPGPVALADLILGIVVFIFAVRRHPPTPYTTAAHGSTATSTLVVLTAPAPRAQIVALTGVSDLVDVIENTSWTKVTSDLSPVTLYFNFKYGIIVGDPALEGKATELFPHGDEHKVMTAMVALGFAFAFFKVRDPSSHTAPCATNRPTPPYHPPSPVPY
jgi:hypothetical protein